MPATVLVGAIPAERHGDIFSATHVRTFLECPSKYFLKYHLGLPETHTRPHYTDEDEDQNDKLFGELEGIITHAVLQKLDLIVASEEQARDLALAESSAHVFDSSAERGRLVNSVCENVLSFCASPFGRTVAGGAGARTEFTLNMAFGGEYVTGTLDRLYRDPDGVIHIVDYKTDAGDPSLLQTKSLHYRPQLAVYALLASRFFRASLVRTSLAFLRHGDAVVHFDFDERELADFERTLAGSIARMKRGDFSRIAEKCSFCTYPQADSCLAT
jgi:hypothetical protein